MGRWATVVDMPRPRQGQEVTDLLHLYCFHIG